MAQLEFDAGLARTNRHVVRQRIRQTPDDTLSFQANHASPNN